MTRASKRTQLSDGREVVWAVFDNDGYECSNFVGVFASQEDAEAVRARIEAGNRKYYAELMKRCEREDAVWPGSVTVKSLIIGEYELPIDTQLGEEGINDESE